MKRKILCSMLAVMTSICMLTACGNSSNPVQDTKSTDATKNDSMVQEEEKQTEEETNAVGTTLSGDDQEAAGEDADSMSRNAVYRSDEFYLSIVLPEDWEYRILSEEDLEKKIICIPVRSVSGRRIIRRISLCWDTRRRLVCVEPA